MVMHKQEKSGYSPQKSTLVPSTKGRIPKRSVPVDIDDVLRRNEQIAHRREQINRSVVALELRVDILLDEVQRVKKKYEVE